jgi:hypothetical protein
MIGSGHSDFTDQKYKVTERQSKTELQGLIKVPMWVMCNNNAHVGDVVPV